MTDPLPHRKYPAHPPPVLMHNRPVILFVTVCTSQRRALLANHTVQTALTTAWSQATDWIIGYHLIMPDHVHLFCAPGRHDFPPVKRWVKYWKRLASTEYPPLKGSWLKDCWDTQMRTQEQYNRKLEYVANNPVRKGLVTRPQDWRFAGNLASLRW